MIHFGWMMSAGILLSLLLTFILFPSGIVLLKKPETPAKSKTGRLFIDTLGRYKTRWLDSGGRDYFNADQRHGRVAPGSGKQLYRLL